MALQAKGSVTHQDILDLPETQVGEIINGRLVAHPRLAAKAHFAKAQLGGVLGHHFGHPSSTRPYSDGGQQG
jgi:hypothetical protein